jgi:hypothetical protein
MECRTDKWWCFNDEQVTPLENDQVGDVNVDNAPVPMKKKLFSAFSK